MKAWRIFRTALHALRRNIMRAVLTTLGIVIGIGAVIAMMAIGTGVSTMIQRSIASMGANSLLVLPGQASSGGVGFGVGSIMTLSPDDCQAIIRQCPAVAAAAPMVRARTQIVYGNRNWVPEQITGTTADYLTVRQWPVAEGEAFSDRDVRNSNKVCLLGQTIVDYLFQGESPIGKEVRLQNVSFRVVGVLERKGANMMGMDQDDIVLAPWSTIKYRVAGTSLQTGNQSSSSAATSGSSSSSTSTQINTLSNIYPSAATDLYPDISQVQQTDSPLPIRFTNVDSIFASGASSDELPVAIKQINELLRERHRIRPGQDDDFNVRNMAEMLSTLTKTAGTMTLLLLAVATISLIVGGVGIMNIMLVSVTERTREIGLRMAVGARARHILSQFLTEAVMLCLLGGIVGILLGWGISVLVRVFFHWPTQVSPSVVILATLVSAAVGIVFGFYPAWKASRLDPIDALRYE